MNKFSSNVKHLKIKKGDKVKIIVGKDAGKEGVIEMVKAADKKVFVGGANLYKRHVKKSQGMEGGIIDLPKPITISNVVLICPNCKKPTRVGYKIEGGIKTRVCKKCGKNIK